MYTYSPGIMLHQMKILLTKSWRSSYCGLEHRVRLFGWCSSSTIFLSHIIPAPASSSSQVIVFFLSHHSSLQLQPAERSVCLRVLIVATTHGQQLAENSLVLDLHETESRFTDATGQARYNPGTYG